jgi:hypothetical protein
MLTYFVERLFRLEGDTEAQHRDALRLDRHLAIDAAGAVLLLGRHNFYVYLYKCVS